MTTLFENPWIILIVGGMMLAMLVGGLIQTGRRAILWAIAATALLTIIMVFVERSVVTPREEIGALLREIAGELESNNHEAVLGYIAEDAEALRRDARRQLNRVTIEQASIKKNLKLTPPEGGQRVLATFNAMIIGPDRAGQFGTRRIPSYFMVEFLRVADEWKIVAVERKDPREGIGQ